MKVSAKTLLRMAICVGDEHKGWLAGYSHGAEIVVRAAFLGYHDMASC